MSCQETSGEPNTMSCEDVRDLLFLYACDELEPGERQQIDAHLENCEECRAALEEHKLLKRVLPTGFIDRKLFYYSVNA